LKVSILCIGKLGSGPEAVLAEGWARRAGQVGRAHGFGPVQIVEVEARRGGKAAEGEALLARLDGAFVIACDERGAAMTSRDFALRLSRLRDDGVARLAFVIGGADGLDPAVTAKADQTMAFGPQTWPHALVRAMLAEQVYRAASLMAGQPYHRD